MIYFSEVELDFPVIPHNVDVAHETLSFNMVDKITTKVVIN